MLKRTWALATVIGVCLPALTEGQTAAPPPKISFDVAIATALEKNPNVAQAAQSILRAEALLRQSRSVYRPTLDGTVTTNVLDTERGFDGLVAQPQVQSTFGAALSYPLVAPSRWAARAQAEDQVQVARLGASDARRQIAVAAAQAYLAVIGQQRQVDVNLLARDNAQAHVDYAKARLDAGAGSRLDALRASQELAVSEVLLEAARLSLRRAQEGLGVLLAADGPVDAAGEPPLDAQPAIVAEEALADRADVRLFSAQLSAAERVARDSWKDRLPTASATFAPQLVTPSGIFQPSRSWMAFVGVQIPVFDGGVRRETERQRGIARDIARLQLTDLELRARAEVRTARATVESSDRALAIARRAAQDAAEVLRITDIAVRAGATTNLELVDAQRRAREADTAVAQAEDRLRQARLELLVALGRFPAEAGS
ncbi:MAG: TolC family protein [Vicinamibacterales bacterium]